MRQTMVRGARWIPLLLGVWAAACVDVPVPADGRDVALDRSTDGPDDPPGDGMPDGARPPADGAPDVDDRPPAPDMAAPDMALFDAAPPDMTPPDMAPGEIDVGPDGALDGSAPVDRGPGPGQGMLAFRVEGAAVLSEPHPLEAVAVGGRRVVTIEIRNVGAGPVVLDDGPELVEPAGGVAFEVAAFGPARLLEVGDSREILLTLAGQQPGAATVELVVHLVDGDRQVLSLGAVAFEDGFVAVGDHDDFVSGAHRAPGGGELWRSSPLPAVLGNAPDVACGGDCRAPGERAPSTARCIAVGEDAGGGVILTTVDGVNWEAVEVLRDPPPLVAVDYGPPWYAVDRAGGLWSSVGGEVWGPVVAPWQLVDAAPTDLAVAFDGQVLVVGSGGFRGWHPPRAGDGRQFVDDLTRVADGPAGVFLAVGADRRWFRALPGGAEQTAQLAGSSLLTDVAFGFAAGSSGWLVVDRANHWQSADGALWPEVTETGLERIAIGGGHAVGLLGGQVFKLVDGGFVNVGAAVRDARAIAASRLCPPQGERAFPN